MKIYRKRKIDFPTQQIDHGQLSQLGKEDASQNSPSQRNPCSHKVFPDQYYCDVFPVHAKDMVQPQLFFSPLHEEGVGIKKKDHGKNAHDPCSQRQNDLHLRSSLHFPDHRIAGEEADKVIDHDYKNTGRQIGEIDFPVFSDSLPGQSWIKSLFHSFSPPARAVSVLDIFSYIS